MNDNYNSRQRQLKFPFFYPPFDSTRWISVFEWQRQLSSEFLDRFEDSEYLVDSLPESFSSFVVLPFWGPVLKVIVHFFGCGLECPRGLLDQGTPACISGHAPDHGQRW